MSDESWLLVAVRAFTRARRPFNSTSAAAVASIDAFFMAAAEAASIELTR